MYVYVYIYIYCIYYIFCTILNVDLDSNNIADIEEPRNADASWDANMVC